MHIDHDKVRREQVRWVILLSLNNARPEGCYEHLVRATVQTVFQDATALEIRRELDYLEDRKLIHIRKEPSGKWWAELTRYGIDIVEYTIDCGPGIARPEKYW